MIEAYLSSGQERLRLRWLAPNALHRSTAPQRVLVNGEPTSQWDYQAEAQKTLIAVACPTRTETAVQII
ncbi:MAG: hypothetical protein JXA78_07835 [Anaerolineales bacterium]|nr:hypothetical protein [Anaerolineales bacterium]